MIKLHLKLHIKSIILYSFSFLMLLFFSIDTVIAAAGSNNSTQLDNATESKITALLEKMTLDEKIGQLSQPVLFIESREDLREAIKKGEVGSFCVIKKSQITPELYNELQRIAVEESRLGIPILFGFDVIHGFRTIFPNPLGISSSWNEQTMMDAADVAASEARYFGIHMAFSPMVDVARDPRWGRIAEGAGEDVELNKRMGAAIVRGFMGDGLDKPDQIGACAKHFVGYGMALGGRDKQFCEISPRTLLDTYLPPFKACVDAGAVSFMAALHDISGVPATANHYTLTEVLKDDWGFNGFVLSDWDSVVEVISHGTVADEEGAAASALAAGTDVEMKSTTYKEYLPQAIESGKVSMDRVDDAVRRLLRIKYRLNLFDNPYIDVKKGHEMQLTQENRATARRVASESMILLKNDNEILPLSGNSGTIAVTGSLAHTNDLYGHWKGNGNFNDVVTAFAGLDANKPSGVKILDATNSDVDADMAIVCVGEPSSAFGESNDVSDITLTADHVKAVKEAKEKYKKVIVVVFCGRPLVLTPIVDIADAILIAWHAGTEAGNALADILYGKVNPTAKTTCSFLKSTGHIPLYYSDRKSGRPKEDNYTDMMAEPLFPFGFGLNYTTFEYRNLRISSPTMSKDGGKIIVSIDVRNAGRRPSEEIVQLYIHDIVADVTRPQMELKDFKKVYIKNGESIIVKFEITPDQLSYFNSKLEEVVEPGEFDLWVGGSSTTCLHKNFVVE